MYWADARPRYVADSCGRRALRRRIHAPAGRFPSFKPARRPAHRATSHPRPHCSKSETSRRCKIRPSTTNTILSLTLTRSHEGLRSCFRRAWSLLQLGHTAEGREMLGLRVSKPSNATKLGFVVMGPQHARERVATATALYFAHAQLVNASEPNSLASLLDVYDFHIIPSPNPDGYVSVRVACVSCYTRILFRSFLLDLSGQRTRQHPLLRLQHSRMVLRSRQRGFGLSARRMGISCQVRGGD
ncbi:hypothetical protein C8F01DRAFT_1372820 [Mycena amicta]|nr:hypothetical protein C8F01DRAFT_1372820 [Mycena amicta]